MERLPYKKWLVLLLLGAVIVASFGVEAKKRRQTRQTPDDCPPDCKCSGKRVTCSSAALSDPIPAYYKILHVTDFSLSSLEKITSLSPGIVHFTIHDSTSAGLTYLPSDIFSSMRNLRVLKFGKVSSKMIPSNLPNVLRHAPQISALSLLGNRMECDCDLLTAMKEAKVKFIDKETSIEPVQGCMQHGFGQDTYSYITFRDICAGLETPVQQVEKVVAEKVESPAVAQPAVEAPAAPEQPAPVAPKIIEETVVPAPVAPKEPEPAAPAAPAAPAPAAPVAPKAPEPVKPEVPAPAAPKAPEPVKPEPAAPVAPKEPAPVEIAPEEPALPLERIIAEESESEALPAVDSEQVPIIEAAGAKGLTEVLNNLQTVAEGKVAISLDINDPYELGLLLRYLRKRSGLLRNIGNTDVKQQVLDALEDGNKE